MHRIGMCEEEWADRVSWCQWLGLLHEGIRVLILVAGQEQDLVKVVLCQYPHSEEETMISYIK